MITPRLARGQVIPYPPRKPTKEWSMGDESVWAWLGFLLFVPALVLADLGLFSGKDQVISPREAVQMSALWIGVALAVGIGASLLSPPAPAPGPADGD